jgi:hypothetical protein
MFDQLAVRVSLSPVALVAALILPLAAAAWLATHRFHGWLSWLNATCFGLAIALFAYLFCIWPLVGIGWRPVPILLIVVASVIGAWRKEGPERVSTLARVSQIGIILLTLAVVAVDGCMLLDCRTPSGAVPAAFPFYEPGVYAVSHGGAGALLNYHYGISPELRYAMDMGLLNAAGRRAAGVLPSDLSAYSSYGAQVVSPVNGVVLEAVDGTPDSPIGGSNPEQPGGNHVAIHDPDHAIAVWLCHLKTGSVRVQAGEHLHVGDPIGQVGNSGSSFEPHLHLCAQRYVDGAFLEGVPLTFDGRFLVRNSTFTFNVPTPAP